MKRGLAIFVCTLVALAGCNNNATNDRNQDSIVQSSSLPPETNYVMENNVNEPLKNSKSIAPGLVDTTQKTNAVDSIVSYMVDTVSIQK